MRRMRILAFLVPAAAVAVLALALSGGTPSQARETSAPSARPADAQTNPPNPTPVFECFRVDAAANQAGADPKATVRLVTDNFGGKLVRVRRLVMMCELALKYTPQPGVPDPSPPTDADTRIFACYLIQRGQDPNDPFMLFTRNFQQDVVQVRTSRVMCEEAAKVRTDAAGNVVTFGKPTGNIWQCFNLDKAKNINQKFRFLTNNFGRDDALVIRGSQLCEEAMKLRLNAQGDVIRSGEATGRVLECFRLESNLDPNEKVMLVTRNFGKVDVVVRRAIQMCEPAEKKPIFTLPNDPALDLPEATE